MLNLSRNDRKIIKAKMFATLGYHFRFTAPSNPKKEYRTLVKNVLGIDLPQITNPQAMVALRHIVDAENNDFCKLVEESLSKMPHAQPQAFIDMQVKHAVITRKMQKINSPAMSIAQQRSEVINDYVQRREVSRFHDKHFYKSREWRELRLLVLSAKRVCELCGRGPSQGAVMHVDHIKSRSLYPELSLEVSNMQLLCDCCNIAKSNTIIDRY